MPTISSGAVSLRMPITVRRTRVPGLLVEHLDRDRIEALLEVEAGQPEVREHAEVPVVAARHDRAVHDRQPRRLAKGAPDLLLRRVAARHVAQAERRRARGTAPSSPRTRYVSDGRPAPTCFASTASTDWLPTAVKSAGVDAGRAPQRRRHVAIGAVAVVPARTWNPPPKSSTSMACTNEPFDAVPVTSVKTTRVNMASVVPVRKRAASG